MIIVPLTSLMAFATISISVFFKPSTQTLAEQLPMFAAHVGVWEVLFQMFKILVDSNKENSFLAVGVFTVILNCSLWFYLSVYTKGIVRPTTTERTYAQ